MSITSISMIRWIEHRTLSSNSKYHSGDAHDVGHGENGHLTGDMSDTKGKIHLSWQQWISKRWLDPIKAEHNQIYKVQNLLQILTKQSSKAKDKRRQTTNTNRAVRMLNLKYNRSVWTSENLFYTTKELRKKEKQTCKLNPRAMWLWVRKE